MQTNEKSRDSCTDAKWKANRKKSGRSEPAPIYHSLLFCAQANQQDMHDPVCIYLLRINTAVKSIRF